MRFKLNLPNDFASEDDYAAAIADAYGDDCDSISDADLYEPIAAAARESGLTCIMATDYGAEWAGTAEQFETCIGKLPDWAQRYASIIEEG